MPLRDILLAVVIAGLIPAAFARPWIGILAWSWIGYMNPHKLSWTLRDLPIAEGIAGATLLGLVLTRDRRAIPWTREMVLLTLLAIHCTITTILAWYPDVAWGQWDKVMKILLFTYVTPMLIFGRKRIHLLFVVIVFSIGFFGFKGGIFSIMTGGQYMIWGPTGSIIGDNNAIGLAMCMVLPLMLLVAREEPNRYIRWLFYATFWLTIISVLFTYSRGDFLGLIVLLGALFWRNKGRIVTVGLVALVALVFIQTFIPQQWIDEQLSTLDYQSDNSSMQRIQAWSVAKNIALERPLLGAGFNFEFANNIERWNSYADFVGPWHDSTRAAHSIYFQMLGHHGFPGLALFLGVLLCTFFKMRRLGRYEYDDKAKWIGRYAKAVQFSLIPFMVAGAFLSLAYFDLFYMFIALSAILVREANEYEASRRVTYEGVSSELESAPGMLRIGSNRNL